MARGSAQGLPMDNINELLANYEVAIDADEECMAEDFNGIVGYAPKEEVE